MEVMDYECSSSPIPKHPACCDARLTTPTHPVHTRWSSLPEELWLKVFTYLEPLDLARVAQVCVEWAYLVRASETLWKCQCLAVIDQDTRQQIMQDRHKDTAPWKVGMGRTQISFSYLAMTYERRRISHDSSASMAKPLWLMCINAPHNKSYLCDLYLSDRSLKEASVQLQVS